MFIKYLINLGIHLYLFSVSSHGKRMTFRWNGNRLSTKREPCDWIETGFTEMDTVFLMKTKEHIKVFFNVHDFNVLGFWLCMLTFDFIQLVSRCWKIRTVPGQLTGEFLSLTVLIFGATRVYNIVVYLIYRNLQKAFERYPCTLIIDV